MCTQHSQRARNTEKRDEGRSIQRREMRDEVREGVWEFWTKCEGLRGVWVFRLSQTMRLHLFFFLNFGLTRPFQPIQTELARFGPRQHRFSPHWHRFQPCRPDSGLATWHGTARTRGLRRPSRVAASDASASAWEPRLCILGYILICEEISTYILTFLKNSKTLTCK